MNSNTSASVSDNITHTFNTLAACSDFGPWHALAIVGCAFAIAWVLVAFIRS